MTATDSYPRAGTFWDVGLYALTANCSTPPVPVCESAVLPRGWPRGERGGSAGRPEAWRAAHHGYRNRRVQLSALCSLT